MAEQLAHDATIVRSPGALSRRLLDGVLVLAPGQSRPVRITEPGDVIWSLLAEPTTVQSLIGELAARFGEPDEIVSSGAQPVLRALLDVGAIRSVDG